MNERTRNDDRMITTCEKISIRTKACHGVNLSTTNPTWIGLRSHRNSAMIGQRLTSWANKWHPEERSKTFLRSLHTYV